jgi:succinate dehydrogenase/fumarate reductase cytochrome b subunit (b558 family)
MLPLGVFVVEHLWTNAAALGGERSFQDAVAHIQSLPALGVLEVAGIFAPLAFHTLMGLRITAEGQFVRAATSSPAYLRYLGQRITGIVVLGFLLAHLWEFRVQKAWFGMNADQFYPTLVRHLSSSSGGVPWIALGYLAGLAAMVFHFANGLWGAAHTWGLVTSRAAARRLGWACGALGAGLFALGFHTVVFFATGSTLFLPTPTEHFVPLATAPCPSSAAPAKLAPPKGQRLPLH